MLIKDGCSNHDDSNCKLEKYRMVENERTMRTESENAERQRSRSKGQVLKWHRVTQRIWKRGGTAGVKRQQQFCLRKDDDS